MHPSLPLRPLIITTSGAEALITILLALFSKEARKICFKERRENLTSVFVISISAGAACWAIRAGCWYWWRGFFVGYVETEVNLHVSLGETERNVTRRGGN
jgi:hypothetical protein